MADADDLHRQGLTAFQNNDFSAAVSYLEQAVELEGGDADIRANLGVVLHRSGEWEKSEVQFREALKLKPDDPSIHYNFGLLLGDRGRLEDALAHYDASLALDDNNAAAHNNRGNILKRLKEMAGAKVAYESAISADSSFAPAHKNLADAEEILGNVQEAEDHYAQVIRLRNDAGSRIRDALLLPVIPESKEQILEYRDRMNGRLDDLIADSLTLDDPLAQVGATNFTLAYHGLNDRPIQEKLAKLYRQACPSLSYIATHCVGNGSVKSNGKIKIGFISAFFFEHTIAKLNHQLINGFPRERFDVQVYSFADIEDGWSKKIRQAADEFTLLPNNLIAARETISDAKLDILYYTDIGMEPLTYFLSFSRLAPVQCVTWGHPVTTGVDTVDYFISSRLIEPIDADESYSEKLVQLESMPASVARPEFEYDQSRNDNGTHPLVICPQSLFKYHLDFDTILQGILRLNGDLEIRLIEGSYDAWTRRLQERFRKQMPDVAERIKFQTRLDRDGYADLLNIADVILDTPHFCGGMTTYEALAVDTPVVTLPGDYMRGRVSLGLYRQMEMTDCVASDADTYVDIVGELCSNGKYRDIVSEKIRQAKSEIFDDQTVIENHVEFFELALAKI